MTTITKADKDEQFESGAVRGQAVGKGMPHLMPFFVLNEAMGYLADKPHAALLELSKVYEGGVRAGYEPRNWEKGMPASRFVDSAWRHYAMFHIGYVDEPHYDQFIWNLCGLAHIVNGVERGVYDDSLMDLQFHGVEFGADDVYTLDAFHVNGSHNPLDIFLHYLIQGNMETLYVAIAAALYRREKELQAEGRVYLSK